jgi:HlyD family secretion protein
MFKKRIFWVLLVIVIAAGAGGYYYYYTQQNAKTATAAANTSTMQTAVARRGDLEITASGSGQIVPASQISLGFDQSGTLIELNVSVGDKVEAGKVLARLQTNNTPESIAASISDANLNVIQAQQTLDNLYANAAINRTQAINDIATYAQQVRDAQYAIDNYNMPTYLQGMDAIQAVDTMKEQLDAARAAFEPYRYYPQDNATRQALLITLNEAQAHYDAAIKRLNYEYALEVAEANLAKARQEYDKYKEGPAADELILAQAQLDNAKSKLALADETQAIIDLTAPISGTVMTVGANLGEAVGSGALITLANLSQPVLEVYLDETDLDKAVLGYEADVTFDAFPDSQFTGKVISVSPSLESVGNVEAVKVLVALDASSLDTKLSLPVGLSASVDIVSGRATNAVLVPVEALRELDAGEYAVFVMENGEPVLRVVKVGLMDVTSAEILSGVQAGDTVTTGIVQTQ